MSPVSLKPLHGVRIAAGGEAAAPYWRLTQVPLGAYTQSDGFYVGIARKARGNGSLLPSAASASTFHHTAPALPVSVCAERLSQSSLTGETRRPPPRPPCCPGGPHSALAPQPPPEGGSLQAEGTAQLGQVHAHPPKLVRPRPQPLQSPPAPRPAQRPPQPHHGAAQGGAGQAGGKRPPPGRCRPLLPEPLGGSRPGSMSASSRRKSKGRPVPGGGSPRAAPLPGAAQGGPLALGVAEAVEAGTEVRAARTG